MTPEERACQVAEKLWGSRWDDLDSRSEVVGRFLPIADAIRAAIAEREEQLIMAQGRGISQAVNEEREACAKLADDNSVDPIWLGDPALGLVDAGRRIAAAIRARASK